MEAPGGVEPPTDGLGNWGFHLHLNRIRDLEVGHAALNREKLGHTAVIWQRIWQRIGFAEVGEKYGV